MDLSEIGSIRQVTGEAHFLIVTLKQKEKWQQLCVWYTVAAAQGYNNALSQSLNSYLVKVCQLWPVRSKLTGPAAVHLVVMAA